MEEQPSQTANQAPISQQGTRRAHIPNIIYVLVGAPDEASGDLLFEELAAAIHDGRLSGWEIFGHTAFKGNPAPAVVQSARVLVVPLTSSYEFVSESVEDYLRHSQDGLLLPVRLQDVDTSQIGWLTDVEVLEARAPARKQTTKKGAPEVDFAPVVDRIVAKINERFSPPAAQQATGAAETKDLLPLDQERYRLHDSVAGLLGRAATLAAHTGPPPGALDSSHLLFTTAETFQGKGPEGEFLKELTSAEAYGSVREAYLGEHPAGAASPSSPPMMTRGVEAVLTRATSIALRTVRSPEIDLRHLLAALLVTDLPDRRLGAQLRLEEMGLDLRTLRERFCGHVRDQGDDDQAWLEVLLGDTPEVGRLSGFDADAAAGADLIGIGKEVRAFARLIAARAVTPPLSIGLFGEWGSGKTFFMRELRREVQALADGAARSRELQRDLAFYKRIVQIEFNAWHYAEGNLWASLVQHIFENLKLAGDSRSQSERLQERLIQHLEFEQALQAEAQKEKEKAQAEVKAAQSQLRSARRKHALKAQKLAELSGRNLLAEIKLSGVRDELQPLLRALKLNEVGDSAGELLGALRSARDLLTRGSALTTALFLDDERTAKARRRGLLIVLVGGPAVALLSAVVMVVLDSEALADVAALATGAATALAGAAKFISGQVKAVRDSLVKVEAAKQTVDRRLEEEQAENVRRIQAAEQALELRKSVLDTALAKVDEAQRRVQKAEEELAKATVPELLNRFIEDRANSGDYRKHLGVLALVRNDFERLSGLIEEDNWQLSPPGPDDHRFGARKAKFARIEDEEREADGRINRIVLYIDDLDRCPPQKVVEVLQAVHLLLAFPLFVV
ncbi:MAG TPA: P-loop NTPase fold protein, partial [Thermoanaerobaculia bacterium]|nr:P-loop NTPase fold protein [Thermoanaerobaculia bacterium]